MFKYVLTAISAAHRPFLLLIIASPTVTVELKGMALCCSANCSLEESSGGSGVRALFFPRCVSRGWNYGMLMWGTQELDESELTGKTVVARSARRPSSWNCGRGDIHPRTWLIHALVPAPLYSPHLHLLTSVSNYSPVSLAQCLSSESLWKGRGEKAAAATMPPTADLSNSKERVKKRQVQAGLLIIEWCRRWGS